MCEPIEFNTSARSPNALISKNKTTVIFTSDIDPFVMTNRCLKPDEELKLRVCRASSPQMDLFVSFAHFNRRNNHHNTLYELVEAVDRNEHCYWFSIEKTVQLISFKYDTGGNVTVDCDGCIAVGEKIDPTVETWILFYVKGLRITSGQPCISIMQDPSSFTLNDTRLRNVYSGRFHVNRSRNIKMSLSRKTAICLRSRNGIILSSKPIKPDVLIYLFFVNCRAKLIVGFTTSDPDKIEDVTTILEDLQHPSVLWWYEFQLPLSDSYMSLVFDKKGGIQVGFKDRACTFENLDVRRPLWLFINLNGYLSSVGLNPDGLHHKYKSFEDNFGRGKRNPARRIEAVEQYFEESEEQLPPYIEDGYLTQNEEQMRNFIEENQEILGDLQEEDQAEDAIEEIASNIEDGNLIQSTEEHQELYTEETQKVLGEDVIEEITSNFEDFNLETQLTGTEESQSIPEEPQPSVVSIQPPSQNRTAEENLPVKMEMRKRYSEDSISQQVFLHTHGPINGRNTITVRLKQIKARLNRGIIFLGMTCRPPSKLEWTQIPSREELIANNNSSIFILHSMQVESKLKDTEISFVVTPDNTIDFRKNKEEKKELTFRPWRSRVKWFFVFGINVDFEIEVFKATQEAY